MTVCVDLINPRSTFHFYANRYVHETIVSRRNWLWKPADFKGDNHGYVTRVVAESVVTNQSRCLEPEV